MMNRPGRPGIGTILRPGLATGRGGGKNRFGTGIIGIGRGGGSGTGLGAGRTCADSAAGKPAARQAMKPRKRQPGMSGSFLPQRTRRFP
jgi:hypothetical protein